MQQAHVPPTHAATPAIEGEPLWWLLLVTGSLWVLFALIVFRFDYTTVAALSILLGTFCIAAAVVEVFNAFSAHGWGRVGRLVLALAFAVVGVVCYAHPGNSFKALASIFAFFLLFRGIFDIVMAFAARGLGLWWVGLVSGTIQILLAFWAAGDFAHKAFLLVVWVGASALAHGIVQIVTAFEIRPRQVSAD